MVNPKLIDILAHIVIFNLFLWHPLMHPVLITPIVLRDKMVNKRCSLKVHLEDTIYISAHVPLTYSG